MTLRFVDSFDDRSSAQLASKYTSSFAYSIVAAAGRNATAALRLNGLNGTGVQKTLDSQGVWIIGFAIKPIALPSATSIALVQFLDAGNLQCQVRYNQDGTLTIHRNGAAIAAPTSDALQTSVYTYVEMKVKVHATDGYCYIHFDGIEVMAALTLDTTLTANDYANSMLIASGLSTSAYDAYIDDLYICDAQGGSNNNFLGDVRIECLLPNGAGGHSDWTPSAGNNYENVDDPANPGPDDDATYNETNVLANYDTFAYPSLVTASGAVVGVAVNLYCRKTDAGARGVKAVTRIGGVDYDNAETESVQDNYSMEQSIYEEDPSDSNSWTVADVNSAEFGYKLES